MTIPPILSGKQYDESSVFTAENLLREARRQKALAQATVPPICVLDPDGDIVRALVTQQRAERDPLWACYHTDLYRFTRKEIEIGVIGCAVGAAFAVLIAEELFASGCQLLISITSSGQIVPRGSPPYFILIDKALRDEGTSYHYLPASDYSQIDPALLSLLAGAFEQARVPVYQGATWTTDAPFRETASAIERCREMGILAVEMEAAALYAFAGARHRPVICFAHVTNQMAQVEGDFEKGTANGSDDALHLVEVVARAWLQRYTPATVLQNEGAMDMKTHWESIYTTKAPTAVSWYQPEPRLSLDLITHAGITPTAQVIDVGGGASTLVDALLARHFQHLTVLDISSAAIQHAKVRLGALADAVTWIEADITNLLLPPAYYDLWHDRAVFHFLTNPADRAKYIQAVQFAVKPGGHIIVATFALDGPTRCSGLEVVRYSPDSLHAAFGQNFQLIESRNETHLTPSNAEQRFVYCYWRRL
jgi:uridine phosphorylase/SAM-dependent methyltransferase